MQILIYVFYYIFCVSAVSKFRRFYSPRYLKDIEYGDCKRFIPNLKYVKVVKVYDGDTITVASKFPKQSNHIYRFSVRLAGIDAPEMNADTLIEKEHAIESRNKLYDLVMNQTIVLDNIRVEKYGRLLAEVYLNDLHINSWLVENELAVPYDGGKKQKIEYS